MLIRKFAFFRRLCAAIVFLALVSCGGGETADEGGRSEAEHARAELVLSEEAQGLSDWELEAELEKRGLLLVEKRSDGARIIVEVELPAGASASEWVSHFETGRWFRSAAVSSAGSRSTPQQSARSSVVPTPGTSGRATAPNPSPGATAVAQTSSVQATAATLAPGEYLATVNFRTHPASRCSTNRPFAETPQKALDDCRAYMLTLSPQWRMVNVRLYNNATANGIPYHYFYDEQVRNPDGTWRDGEWNSGGSIAVVNGYTAVGAFTRHCPRGGKLETRSSGLNTTYVCVGGLAAVGHTPPAIPAQQCAVQAGMRTPNPILPATGEKVFVREDIVDHAPHPLTLSLHYRTRWQLAPHSAMGAMWGHSHGTNLRLDPTDAQGNTLILQHGDGSQVVFKRTSASGTWISPTHIANLQAFTATGSIPALRYTDPQDGIQWEFARPVGTGTGRLLLQRLENGWSYTYTYNAQGRLTQIQNHFGRTLRLAYHPNGLLAQLQGPDGHAVRYVWDAQSRLQRVVYPGAAQAATSYLYENTRWPEHITAEVDERGQRRHSISYDAQGRATATVRPGNADRYQVSYGNTTGLLNTSASITDPLGTVRQFGYAQTNGKTDVVAGSNLPGCQGETPIASRTQTAQGKLDTETDFQGNVTHYAWDGYLRLTRVTRAANTPAEQTTTITWHHARPKPTVIQEPLKRTNYTYDSLGRLTVQTVTHTAGAANGTQEITRYAYTDQRLVSAVTAPNGAVTHYTYDTAGLPSTITNPLGHVTRLSHDAAGRPTRITEPTGLVRTLSYNERGWLVRSSAQGEAGGPALETNYAYTPSGQVARITQPSGHVVSYSYDNAQRLIGWSDNRGQSARFTLDAVGNRVQETVLNRGDGIALQVAREVNQINRLSREVLGGDQRSDYAYDANGRLRQALNAAGHSTAFSRDALARITSVTNALGQVARLDYDRGNAINSVSDFKSVSTAYTRDAKGNATSEQSPDVGSSQNSFDALGLPQSVVDSLGRATHITRDLLGRPTRVTQSASGKPTLTTELRYDLTGSLCNATGHPSASLGRLCEMITREGEAEAARTTTRFQWDAFGRLRQQAQNLSSAIADHSQVRNVSLSYVPSGAGAGELTSITYPSGAVLSYQYDSTGSLNGMRWNNQPLLQNITYNALGQPLSWTWRFAHASASLPATRSYNAAGQLISSETGAYHWNNLGQLASFSQALQRSGGSSGWVAENVPHSASYDATGRLLQLRAQGSVPALQAQQSYTYDANGNRMNNGVQAGAASNRLLRAGGQAVQINAAGEVTWQTGQALRYDAGGRLHQIKACASSSDSACATSENGATRHWYNGMHQRVLREDPTGQTVYVYGTDGHNVLGEYSQASTATTVQSTEHIYLPTASGPMPVAAVISGQHYAVHSDHLNTPRRLTDNAQRVRWQWAYSGYGETQAQPLAMGSLTAVPYNLRYPGQVDDGNGLFYNWHRFYHPASGRYVSADPIGLEGGWNRYSYVDGNPLAFADPLGLARQYTVGVSAIGQANVALGGGTTIGVSVPDNWRKWRCYQLFSTGQANAYFGVGGFLGVGFSGGTSKTDGPIETGRSSGISTEGNIGWGIAGGASATAPGSVMKPSTWLNNTTGYSGTIFPKLGAGFGVGWAFGNFWAFTLATPPVGDDCGCE